MYLERVPEESSRDKHSASILAVKQKLMTAARRQELHTLIYVTMSNCETLEKVKLC